MRLRKALSVVLATTLALTTPIQVFATDNVEIILPDKVNSSVQEPGAGKSDVILKSEAASFNVTLPTVLPITVTSDGTVITSDEVKLTNQSAGPVEIKSVEVVSQNNWNLVEFGTDFSNSKVGLSKYGLQLKGDNIPTSGLLGELSWGAIANSKELPLNYDANIAPQKNSLTDLVIANVVFTVGWYEATGSEEVEPPYEGEAPLEGEEYISGNYSYVYGSHYDENGAIVDNKLSGWSVKIIDKTKTSYVQPLEEIKGEPVISYVFLFREYANSTLILEGTWTNRNVTNMNQMFNGSRVNTLDISNFNTSNVVHMSSMFKDYQATTLDISSFNTSNVTSMNDMFYGCQATVLDLSSFDTGSVVSIGNMFQNCQATTGYARTQSDANKFNATENKPSNLTFVVKSGGEITPPIVAPIVGEKYQEGNYEYTYSLDGWSVRVIDSTQTVYRQPLEEIKGKPVTSYKWMFNNYPNTTLTLEGTWTNRNITDMSYAFYGCEATTLDLSSFNTSNVTNMSYAFYGCEATTLDLSNFNTSNVTNMICMFAVCIAGTLDLSSFDTSNVTNMDSMFFESKATTLNLSSFDTSNVTNMGSMFQSCQMTMIDLSSFNTQKVTNMNYMFQICKATTGYARTQADADKLNTSSYKPSTLNFIIKPPVENEVYTEGNYKYTYNERNKGWQVSIIDNSQLSYKQPLETIKNVPVTSYSELFRDYPNATLILEGVWENKNVTDMGWMFIDCKATTINLANFKTDNVVSMSTMFRECLATTINVSSFNTSNVRSMGMMFYAVNTKTLDLKSFNTSNVTDMNNMFGNSGILELDLSSFDTSNVEYMVDIFSNCKATIGIAKTQEDADRFNSSSNKPASLTFNTGLKAGDVYTEGNYKYVYGYNRNTSGNVDTNAPINGWSVSIIDKTKTSYAQPLEKIKGQPVVSYYSLFELYPNNTLSLVGTWTNSNVKDMRRVFCNCKATVLNIGDFKTVAATDMTQMFGNCSATTLDLSSFNTSNVTDMHWMFGGSKATTLDLSSFDTSNVTVMSGVFSNSQATTIDISSFNTSNVTNMNSMFYQCRATTLNLSSFNTRSVTDMTSMFDSCQTTTLNLNSFDTSSVILMRNMFQNCQANTGYARTQSDANKFNATENKPSTLNFIAKPVEGETYTEGNYKYTYLTNNGWGISIIDKTQTKYKQPLEQIKGEPVRYYKMFYEYPNTTLILEGVWENNGIRDMQCMFESCTATSIDLSNFYTSDAERMNRMFAGCKVKTLDLRSFDTSKVTSLDGMFNGCEATNINMSSFNTNNIEFMQNMFMNCKASTLDLSSFDTVKLKYSSSMFQGSQATTGYARNQADADKLNSTTFKPSTLNFIVKPTVINKIVKLEVV